MNDGAVEIPIIETFENGIYGGPACAIAKSENASKLLIAMQFTPLKELSIR